jgi:hypothetical protein
MVDLKEQCTCVNFVSNSGKPHQKIHEMPQTAVTENAMGIILLNHLLDFVRSSHQRLHRKQCAGSLQNHQ